MTIGVYYQSMTESIREFTIEDLSNDLEKFPITLIYYDMKEFEELQNIFHKVKDLSLSRLT